MYSAISQKEQYEASDCEAALLVDTATRSSSTNTTPPFQGKKYPTTKLIWKISKKTIAAPLRRLANAITNFRNSQWYFTPTELLPAWWNWTSSPPPKLHPTSWLDGLCGVGALFVFIHHLSQIYLRGLRPGYGRSPEAYHILQLPVLRIVFSGGAIVAIFFVIPGYVLSTKALLFARQGRHLELFENLASSAIHRGRRLIIPCIVSTFLTAMLAMTGAFEDEGVARHYPRAGTLWEQLGSWMHETL
ncbi:MAG: hypothetical protein L6R42_008227 [Xanthoria sp. 1 TBL-2021]|nr:MAG: hypothetical protein L6R42_008227 [Xanthoria sp. 1 TBL-2021]